MATELRKSGINGLGDMPWGTHFCNFYETKQDLLDTLVPYFKAGLENGEFCIWVKSAHLDVEEARKGLLQAGPDLAQHLEQRNIEIISHKDWFLQGGAFDLHRVIRAFKEKLQQALARGYAGMRVSGDDAWVAKQDWRDFREFEKELDVAVANQRMIVLCSYPLAACGAAELLDVARTHQVAVALRNGIWEVVEPIEIKKFKAEIERLNQKLEQRVMERTQELKETNDALKGEIVQRKKTEQKLERYKAHLESQVGERTAQLEQANERLKEMDRLKSLFIASTSHELRTPLNSIIGFSSILLDQWIGPLNNEQKESLDAILRSGKHLLSLINDIIDISKIEAGKIGTLPEGFSLKELVDEAVALVTPQLQEKGLPLERELSDGLMLYADRKRLLQCLVNLLSNATKFSERGRIAVAARESDGRIELSVTDSGIGIAERDLPRLFKPFERLESRLRVPAGGTGLGLYLTAKLVDDILHGSITVVSREGEGSTFTLSLPRDVRRVPEPPEGERGAVQ